MTDTEIIKKLTSIRGIGNWSAKMYLIFVLNRQDILPLDDAAFLQSYCWMNNTKDRTKLSVEKNCIKWKPYSSIATRYLYRALDTGLTNNKFTINKED
jgi:DNA-3-methyladenine glycosylase II